MERVKSEKAWQQALHYIPGGVNSPVRSLGAVGETPLFIRKASGAELTDIDGNRFIDFCLSWGVFIAGHTHPKVTEAAIRAIESGSSYGIPSEGETSLAELVNRFFPSMQQVRFVSSGTEAVMSAVRLARGFTGRNLLVKFDGCYHGHADHLLVSAGSGVAAVRNSSSQGVPQEFLNYTISLPYNDQEAVEAFFRERGNEVAAVILEPIACNMGVVLPREGYLSFLREITHSYGAVLIFDEVITGFRLAAGGAQSLYNICPDLTTVGKIVGGGFPAAAFGGRKEIMQKLAPLGDVYQAGTLSGNPVAMAAGVATLNILSEDNFYRDLEEKSRWFTGELKQIIAGKGVTLNSSGSMFTLFFTGDPVTDFSSAKKSDQDRFARFFRYLLNQGIYLSPSQMEGNFISRAHTRQQLDKTLKTIENYFNTEG